MLHTDGLLPKSKYAAYSKHNLIVKTALTICKKWPGLQTGVKSK